MRRLTQIGAVVAEPIDGDALTVTPPSWRPDLRQPADLVEEVLRLEGLEVIPSVLPLAPAGRGPHRGAEAPPRHRQVAGPVRLRRDPADTVSARRRVRPVGPAGRRSAAHHDQRAQPAGGRPPAAGHHVAARLCWKPWGATFPAALVDVSLFAIAQVVQPTERPAASSCIPVDRRPTDDEIATLDDVVAAAAAARRRGAGRAARTARPVGPGPRGRSRRRVRGGADHRARQRRRRDACASAQYLPWHPGRCAEVLVGETLVGHAGQLHPGGHRARRACRRARARSNWTSTRFPSSRRCPRRGCRRSRRCSRTSASWWPRTSPPRR